MSKKSYKPHYEHLKNKWGERQRELQKNLFEKHKEAFAWFHHSSKQLAFGSISSLIMLTHVATPALAQQIVPTPPQLTQQQFSVDKKEKLIEDLSIILPNRVQPLTEDQEKIIGQTLTRSFAIPVTAQLQEKRLNRSYGFIGAEQHLMRYPGDTIDSHFANTEAIQFTGSGMAPGRGSWGYFASSQSTMTQKDSDREKYYIAVQTFLAPGYSDHLNEYYNFFKFRKMLVVNPENGKAIIVVIGDAGPAQWTGKHLGGSPEVMRYLERQDGRAKGPVLYFFVNDPDDTIPLGPIDL